MTFTIILLSLCSVNALIISEIESNPDGADSKNEWIELYSEEEIDGNYILANNDAGEVYDNQDSNQLKIHFNFVGYHIYIFNGQWLDNSDEKVYLYDEYEKLIDSTNLFDDGGDSDFTWQRCDKTWVFKEETKGTENCVVGEPESGEEINKPNKTEELEETILEENSTTEKSIIKLDSKDIKSKNNKKEIDKNKYAIIGLSIIVVVFLSFLVLQRYRQRKKNEFR